jgi:hypothetical protein
MATIRSAFALQSGRRLEIQVRNFHKSAQAEQGNRSPNPAEFATVSHGVSIFCSRRVFVHGEFLFTAG